MTTTNDFHLVPLTEIWVDRNKRQRTELRDVDKLADSLATIGLLNPITINRNMELIAGERRLTAARNLGWETIPAHFYETLDPVEMKKVELEENIRRHDLTWQETAAAVKEYHDIRIADDPQWSQERTAEALNISKTSVSRYVQTANALERGDESVTKAPTLRAAANIVTRKTSRAIDVQIAKGLQAAVSPQDPEESSDEENCPHTILNEDFIKYISSAKVAPYYDVLHCDFPYGVNHNKSDQGNAAAFEQYDDTTDVYWELVEVLVENLDKFMLPDCHIIFWLSMNFYHETKLALEQAGFTIVPQPLIWHKTDNKGVASDVERRPRNVYEAALYGWRGNRKQFKLISNVYGAPTTKEIHVSEKPVAMLKHFMSAVVDEHSKVIDPTCGSGNAIRAAIQLNAARAAGYEIRPTIAKQAAVAVDLDWQKRRLAERLGG